MLSVLQPQVLCAVSHVKMGVLDASEIEDCISIEWSKVRAGFYKKKDVWTSGVLNLGVSPKLLVQNVCTYNSLSIP